MEINEGAVSNTDPAGTHAFDAATPVVARAPVVPVSLLVSSARLLLERQIGLIWVSGEIGNYTRAASGHCYFNLKDAHAQVRCVLFRLRAQHVAFALRDGLAIEVRATPSLYEARGEFQLNVETIRLAGLGALYERFMQLKAKLDAAGWFAPSRKRALPSYPHIIGIVTSTRAAALRDILTTLKHRWPSARVVIYPAAVQGEGAAIDLARAIRLANARREADVLIVARGGAQSRTYGPSTRRLSHAPSMSRCFPSSPGLVTKPILRSAISSPMCAHRRPPRPQPQRRRIALRYASELRNSRGARSAPATTRWRRVCNRSMLRRAGSSILLRGSKRSWSLRATSPGDSALPGAGRC